jgi:DNA-binding MarR family transcriptional regulator
MSARNNDEITRLIRRISRGMAHVVGGALEPPGISGADRTVLEFLYPDQALTVPEIAARYDASRQHVQVTVNSLSEKKLVEHRSNPRHKRSNLIQLTASGRALFDDVRNQESALTDALFKGLSPTQLAATLQTLRQLNQRLAQGDAR